MLRPKPIQNEITFELDEMFYSVTNHRGIILECNEVFRKLSRYSREEIIGSAHNIIRHPDMPKVIFKTLWDTILAGRPICAYIKNLAKDGSYYWVFATVIPIGEDFLSIRMKPTAHLKEVIENLYKELLSVEKISGVDASLKALVTALNSLGFPDYDSFGQLAISTELLNRNELQSKEAQKSNNENSFSASKQDHLTSIGESLFRIFGATSKLSTRTKAISEKIVKIRDISKSIEFAALNTIIEAERLGSDGKALAVIAEHISTGAVEAKKLNSSIGLLATKMLEVFASTQFSVALSTLQVEMLSCFILQRKNDPSSMDEAVFNKNVSMLISQLTESLKVAELTLTSLSEDVQRISLELGRTSEILSTLHFIQKSGSIESARLVNGSIFSQLFVSIMGLINESKIIYSEFSEIVNREIKNNVMTAIEEYKVITGTLGHVEYSDNKLNTP
ncbi:MAG: methyl-accepting chemotaxis protein [Bacteriovoracaceae bacterium]|nr:methyl-accepting chemotaxis protein [Bacteriovoracaceae bacterium]